jgi:cathepsin L
MSHVYEYAKLFNMARDSNYTYSATQGLCTISAPKKGPYKVRSYTSTARNNCNTLFIQAGLTPVVVAVAVAQSTQFMSYKSGIIGLSQCPATRVDHAVVVVGYDANKNWKILNSWGTSWGQSGYAWLAFGNTCNICSYGGFSSTIA